MKLENMSDGVIAQQLHAKGLTFRPKNNDLADLLFEAEKRLQEKARSEASVNAGVPRGRRRTLIS